MRIPRIYQAVPLQCGDNIVLDAQATNHVIRVLRLKQNDPVILFNGQGGEYTGVLDIVDKRCARVQLQEFQQPDNESPLYITLMQGVSRGERMDFTLQKSVELGVNAIFPVLTQHSTVHLDAARAKKKQAHWQGVVNSACEQSGRDVVPRVYELDTLQNQAHELTATNASTIVLHHRADNSLPSIAKPPANSVVLVVGPEGGLSDEELDWLHTLGCAEVKIGPRILRTETAALTAIAVMQALWGDFDNR